MTTQQFKEEKNRVKEEGSFGSSSIAQGKEILVLRFIHLLSVLFSRIKEDLMECYVF